MICPHCEQPILGVTIKEVKGTVPFGTQWNCVGYSCSRCHKVLSVQIDPIAVKTDLVSELLKKLRGQ